MRKQLVIVGALALVVAVPAVALAASGVLGSALERQAAKWTTTSATTASAEWRNVPRLSLSRCTVNQVSATLSVTVTGGPVQFRVITDGVQEAPMQPGAVRFVPDGAESFSFGFAGRTAPFEADDTHRFDVQWRSPTGARVVLRRGVLNLLFERGTQGCP
jgi:hypothetical protein